MSALQGVRDIINPAGKVAREDAAKAAAQRAAERRMDLRWLMGDARGRRVICRELTRAGLFETTTRADPRGTEHAAVLKDHALALFNELMASAPDETLGLFRSDPVHQLHVSNAKK